MAGKFIIFEGLGASGKTTQIKLLTDRLHKEGFDVVNIREPGGTPFSEALRTAFLDHANLSPVTELLTLMAARRHHEETVIVPALKAGKVVICDRFDASTYANQIQGDQELSRLFTTITRSRHTLVNPNTTLYLDVSPKESYERSLDRGTTRRYDVESITHRGLIRRYLHEYAHTDPSAAIIDGTDSTIAVHETIYDRIRSLLGDHA